MCALPLNLLVVLGAQWPPLGEAEAFCEDEPFHALKAEASWYAVPKSPLEQAEGEGRPKRSCSFHPENRRPETPGELEIEIATNSTGSSMLPGSDPFETNPTFEELISPSPSPSMPSRPRVDPRWQRICERDLPDLVCVPRSAMQLSSFWKSKEVEQASKIILHLTRDNIAALAVIATLNVFGAIYLWKICTRRSCSCKLCRNGYRSLDLLGCGGYGSVYLVERMPNLERFVSKKIPVREITEVDEYSREAKELIMLRHRHIVSYEEDFVHVEYGGLEPKTYFIIIMEFCPEGDLKEKIEQDFLSFTEDWVRTIFAQLLQAVQYLHSKNVIHRDLKSQNVFLSQEGHVRLGDFGLCRHAPRRLGNSTLTHAGTDCYMAPEMLSSSRYGKPADMWSLGCILYELCTGQFMWELDGILGALVMKDSHMVQKFVQKEIAPAVGSELKMLLKRLLNVNPASRPTATNCIRKKLFKRWFQCSKESFGQSLGEVVEDPPLEVDTASDGLSGVSEGDLSEGGDGTTGSADSAESDTETEATLPPPSPYSSVRRSDLPKGRRRKRRGGWR